MNFRVENLRAKTLCYFSILLGSAIRAGPPRLPRHIFRLLISKYFLDFQCQVAVQLSSEKKSRQASTASIWFGGHHPRDQLTENSLDIN